MTLTLEQLVKGLIDQGATRENAERLARRRLGIPEGAPVAARSTLASPVIVFPIGFHLPWSSLISDNRKYGAVENQLILTPEYRQAKRAIAGFAREFLVNTFGDEYKPVAIPLALSAKVWVPDETRAHDVANFAKCCHDALEGVVYVKDRWLYRVLWERAGVNVDGPHAEIRITHYLPAAS